MNKGFMIVAAIFAGVLLFGCTGSGGNSYASPTPGSSNGQGHMVFMMKDAAADMSSVSDVQMTVDKVEAHSSSSASANANAWTTVSNSAQAYDLTQLKSTGSAQLMAQADAAAGTYDQIRYHVSSVKVTDSTGVHEAAMPSNTFTANSQMVVDAGATSTATADVLADQSLHATSSGGYAMTTVAKIETRENANVDTSNSANVQVSGGTVTSSQTFGMDLNGNVGAGVQVPVSAVVDVGANGALSIATGAAGNVAGSVGGAVNGAGSAAGSAVGTASGSASGNASGSASGSGSAG